MASRDPLLKLNDKTVAIVGSFSSTTQMVLSLLSEQGADVALVGKETPEARRYIEHLNDQREIYPHYGRAGVIAATLNDAQEAPEVIARVVHSFGRLDSLVDTLPCERTDLRLTSALAAESLKFLTSRPRSRLLWLTHHRDLMKPNSEIKILRERYSRQLGPKGLTANELVLGISEEYLLRRSPGSPSIKAAFEDIKREIPHARLLEPFEVAAWVMFLASPLSQALNGHALNIDHGLTAD